MAYFATVADIELQTEADEIGIGSVCVLPDVKKYLKGYDESMTGKPMTVTFDAETFNKDLVAWQKCVQAENALKVIAAQKKCELQMKAQAKAQAELAAKSIAAHKK